MACGRLKRSPSVPVSRRVPWRLVHELRRQGVAGVPRVMRMERIARTARTSRFRRTSPFSRRMRAQRTPRGSRGSRYSLTSRFFERTALYTHVASACAVESPCGQRQFGPRCSHPRPWGQPRRRVVAGGVFGSASEFLDVISQSSTYRPSPPHLRQTHLHHTSCHRLHDVAHRHRPP